jgi:hypothetical protein
MSNTNLTFEAALSAYLESEEPTSPSRHRAKTSDCVSTQKLENHIRAASFLNTQELRHINRCPDFCQRALQYLMTICSARVPRISSDASHLALAASGESSGLRSYQGVSQSNDGVRDARLMVTDGPFLINGGYIAMRMAITTPLFAAELMPLRLALCLHLESSESIFVLDLPTQSDEVIKLKMENDAFLGLKRDLQGGNYGFTFAIEPLGKPTLIASALP